MNRNKNYYDRYPTCNNVFNIRKNNIITHSECPLGMKGLQGGMVRPDCLDDKCRQCIHYAERKSDLFSVDESLADNYKETQLKELVNNKKIKQKISNTSFLYNDIMINNDDKVYFNNHCHERISQKTKRENKLEAKKIKATDIL